MSRERCSALALLLLHRWPLLLPLLLPAVPCQRRPVTAVGPWLHSREGVGPGRRRRNRSSSKAAVAAGLDQPAGSRLLACLPLARAMVAAGPGQQVQPALLHLLLQAHHSPPLCWCQGGRRGTPGHLQAMLPRQQQLAAGLLSGGAHSAGPVLSAGL